MSNYSIFQLGDQAVTFSFNNAIGQEHHPRIMAMKAWLHDRAFAGLLDSIVSYHSLTLIYDAFRVKQEHAVVHAFEFVQEKLKEAYRSSEQQEKKISTVCLRIPVCYESCFAYDLEFISAHAGLTPQEVIDLHVHQRYRVYMIGFLPGFPYLGEVDKRIAVSRKEKPRAKVEAGSVGIAGVQTGIYPVDSPGGWQIIGRTPLTLFAKNEDPPVRIEAGDEVQFYPISKQAFENYSESSL
jgi:inhibitor of KinA